MVLGISRGRAARMLHLNSIELDTSGFEGQVSFGNSVISYWDESAVTPRLEKGISRQHVGSFAGGPEGICTRIDTLALGVEQGCRLRGYRLSDSTELAIRASPIRCTPRAIGN